MLPLITAAPVQTCDKIRTVRFQSNGDGGKVTAINLTDNNGIPQWTDLINDNSAWYEIPVDGSTTDFYYKNVETGNYLYRENTGKTPGSCDWQWESILLSETNAKTDYYKFRVINSNSNWGNRYWIVNVAAADFVNINSQGAFVLSGINNNHTSCGMPAYPAVVATALPNDDNYWHSTAATTVNASVDNPDCETPTCDITISVQPKSASYLVGDITSALQATVSGSNLSYTWYRSTDNSNNTPANDTQLSTTATYTPEATTAGTFYYYVTINNGDCSVTSNVATISVTQPGTGTPTYPAGYPKTMAMQNPLFWQFGSEKVTDDNAGTLIPGSKGNLYTADPSAHVWNINGVETLFVYASHDMEAPRGCDRMDRYHVYSTTDMVNWTDYGEIIKADDVPWSKNNTFINGSKFMWAPDAAYKNGKYYFYFPHPSQNSDNGAGSWGYNWKIGIAVSDHPASDFTILDNPLALSTGFEYDPCVFVDDDGQAYLYYGGGANPYVVKLKDNMTEIDGTPQVMQGLNNFHEGIWVHKRNGIYYLSYPDNGGGGDGNGDQLKYAMSDSPTGPWESIGAYVYATGCGTIHGSIVEFKGQSYAFYHSDYVSHNGDQGRSVHVDKLYYNPDGTIQLVNNFGQAYKGPHNVVATTNTTQIALTLQAEDFNTGGETYGYHDTKNYAANPQGNTYRSDATGIAIEARAGGVYNIGDIDRREFLRYTINVEKGGLYDIDCYVASENNGGRFHLNVNGVNKSGEVKVTGNGGWGDSGFAKLTVPNIPLKTGENLFELRVRNSGGFNIDRFEFRNSEPYTGQVYTQGNHNVPGTIEAEDYDIGGQGISYFQNAWGGYGADENAGGAYRTGANEGVDIQTKDGGGYNISHTSGGEWIKYTINVTETGIYDVDIYGANNGSVSISFDDIDDYPSVAVATTGWGAYLPFTVKDVSLTKGIHVMTLYFLGGPNIDKFTFKLNSNTPVQPSVISGNTTPCKGTAGLTYSVTNVDNVTYTWTVPTGWNITNGNETNTITVTATDAAVAGIISVTPSNAQGNGPARTLAVSVNNVPAQPGIISGSATVCKNKTGITYSVENTTGVTYNWTVPTGWTITNGDETNTITVATTGAAIAGNIEVTPSNTCGNGTSRTLAVTVNDVPAQPGVITGEAIICKGQTGLSYSVENVPGLTYTWTVPTGWTISGSNNTNTIAVNTSNATSGTITVKATNTCGDSAERTLAVTVNDKPAQPGTITGNAIACKGKTGLTYSVAAVAGATSYKWTVPTGWTITAGENANSITVSVTAGATNGNITVKAANDCGDSAERTLAVTVNDVPAQPSTITGNATVCKNKTGITYSVENITGVTYNWTVPTGWTITNGDETNTITVTTTGAAITGNIEVTPSNTCGNGTSRTLAVTVNDVPAQPSAITGEATICKGQTGLSYSVENVPGLTYAWTLPTGWTINGSNNTNSITVNTTNATSGTISVTASNACGENTTASTLTVTVNNIPATPGTISGDPNPCKGTTGLIYSVAAVEGATSYVWTVPTGWNITNGENTASITVTATTGATTGSITVKAKNDCGSSAASTLAVTGNNGMPEQPGAITGVATVCKNKTGITYSVANVTGTTYTWKVPTGWNITAGQTTHAITISTTASAVSGNIEVTAGNGCGTNNTASTLAVTVNDVPAQPSAITGKSTICKGQAELSYSVEDVPGLTYAWTLPTGWTISGSNNTNAINVNTTNATSGTITVKASNDCGYSAERTLIVTVNDKPAQPGTITGSAAPCKGATTTYSVAAVAGATSYTWTVPAGWNITDGENTNSITVDVTPAAIGGIITVKAINTCGNSAERTLTVNTNNGVPAQPDINGIPAVCKNTTGIIYSVMDVAGTTYTWTVPTGWTITTGQYSSSITVTAGASATSDDITVTPSNGCGTGIAATLAVTANDVPAQPGAISGPASVAKGTNGLTYSVTDAPGTTYTWTVPAGWTIASGQNANSITVNAGNSAVSGSITVTPTNSSGCAGATSSRDVTITIPVGGISIDNNISVNKGETKTLNHEVTPADATNKNVTYNIVSGHGCIEIDHENGTITGIAAGTVVLEITTVDGNKKVTCTITVADDGVGLGTVNGDDRSIIAYDNIVQVNGLSEGEIITVYNLIGATMHTQKADRKTEYIYGLRPGMYTVTIEGTGIIQKVLVGK